VHQGFGSGALLMLYTQFVTRGILVRLFSLLFFSFRVIPW